MLVVAEKWKQWARTIKRDAHALYLAARDPRVPWYAKALAIAVAAYALSPIDLIPDFVPVLGYVDDLIIVPAGIALVIRLIPHGTTSRYGGGRSGSSCEPGGGHGDSGNLAFGYRPDRLDCDALLAMTDVCYWPTIISHLMSFSGVRRR